MIKINIRYVQCFIKITWDYLVLIRLSYIYDHHKINKIILEVNYSALLEAYHFCSCIKVSLKLQQLYSFSIIIEYVLKNISDSSGIKGIGLYI